MHLLPTFLHPDRWFISDSIFHRLFPQSIQQLACRHWTPLSIARKAAHFLTPADDVNVLDIGSGVGTFCLTAAHYKPNAFFTGVEQRHHLVEHAEKAREKLSLQNVQFQQANFTSLDFKEYDHFYYYNSFYENLEGNDKIDKTVGYTDELYRYYCQHMFEKLGEMRVGTRLATFQSLGHEIPPSYHLLMAQEDNLLKFWIKK